MKVVNMHAVFHGAETEFIGGAIHHAPLDSTTGKPHGKAIVIVIPAIDPAGIGAGLRYQVGCAERDRDDTTALLNRSDTHHFLLDLEPIFRKMVSMVSEIWIFWD